MADSGEAIGESPSGLRREVMQPAPQPLSSPRNNAGLGEALSWLAAAWFCSMFCGVFVLRGDGALAVGNSVAFDRAVLTSVSAATLTGFQQDFANFDDFSPFVQGVLATETFLGVSLALLTGGLAVTRAFRINQNDLSVMASSAAIIIGALVIGALTLPGNSPLGPALNGLFAVSGTNLTSQLDPAKRGSAILGTMLPLAFAGTCGPVVLLELFRRRIIWSQHAGRMLFAAALSFIAFIAATFLVTRVAHEFASATALGRVIGSVQAGGVATAMQEGPRAFHWLLIFLIVLGSGTAGTSGGVGVLWRYTTADASRRPAARLVSRFLLAQFSLVFAGMLVLVTSEPQTPADRLALTVVGAAFDVGVGQEPLALVGVGAYVVSVLMISGRLLPLVLVWMLARQAGRDDAAGLNPPASRAS